MSSELRLMNVFCQKHLNKTLDLLFLQNGGFENG
jgi:hypothetical protein